MNNSLKPEMAPVAPVAIESVQQFWNAHPCDTPKAAATNDRLAFFLSIEERRYRDQPHIREVGRFDDFRGRRVLEVGCGVGTDGVQFAKGGAEYVGVDLTDAGVANSQENFSLRNLSGRFQRANAETLPFPDQSFDHVYSFGVIHHTVTPARIVGEIHRVLKPGGTVSAMLYNRNSANYYLQICLIRRLGRLLLRPRFAPALFSKILRLPLDKLEGHRESLLRIPNPTKAQWISMNTDGPECPLARVYSASEAKNLFSAFSDLRTYVEHFDRDHWSFLGKLIPDRLARSIGKRWGWHRMITGVR
jgi:ubiquinone/menaquinone biosynthesis C-methylase UbiE